MSEVKEILLREKVEQEKENYIEGQINWLDDLFWDSWDKIKGHFKKINHHKTEYKEGERQKWYFLAHARDVIQGKPQLIDQVQKKIPLIRLAINKLTPKKAINMDIVSLVENLEIKAYFFFDEKFDKRHDGFQQDAFSLDFWLYKVISPDGKEYFVLSKEQLPNTNCIFNGMLVELDDFAEMSRSMKLKSLSRLFFAKSWEPEAKVISPKELVKFTQERAISIEDWHEFLSWHTGLCTRNEFPIEVKNLKSAQILSSQIDDYPMHVGILGPQGTRKSKGYVESLAQKFSDKPNILEGANSRLKGLTPSFKEKPANIGYLAKAERMGWVDELGKMVEQRMFQDNLSVSNLLGELNFLLDHSRRVVGSGNDNDIVVQATAKFLFVMNPISNRPTLHSHVGIFDPTFMSRILWWVQDEDEQEFVLSDKGIVRLSDNTETSPSVYENRKKDIVLKKCYRKVYSNSEFLTIFDSCNAFLSVIDTLKINSLVKVISEKAKEPMKSVWIPRAEHHVSLLVDGICKQRCLFRDYDSNFVAIEEDYEIAKAILLRMVKSWDIDLSPKKEKSK